MRVFISHVDTPIRKPSKAIAGYDTEPRLHPRLCRVDLSESLKR